MDRQHHDRIEARTGNSGLAKAGLKEVIEHLYYYQHLCLISADGFQIPCLRQAVNRWQKILTSVRAKNKLLEN